MPTSGTQNPTPGLAPPSQQNTFNTDAAAAAAASGSTAGLPGSTTQGNYVPPSAASSAYEYENYVAGLSVKLGPQLQKLLHTSSTNAATIMQAFTHLSQADLTKVQQLLYSAGFYQLAAGGQLSSRPTFGTADSLSQAALAAALTQSSNGNKSLTDTINTAISSGAGKAATTVLPSATVGGGNAYEIDLSNPDTIATAVNAAAQTLLGRNATQAELDQITQQVQSQEYQTQQASNQNKETMQQKQFQASVQSNATQTASQTQPVYAGGNIPNGNINSPAQYAQALIGFVQGQDTQANVALVTAWINAMGLWGNGQMNPLGVQTGQGQSSLQNGTQKFTSWAQSLQAAASMLENDQTLMAALKSADASKAKGVQQSVTQMSGGKVTPQDLSQHEKLAQGPAKQLLAKQKTRKMANPNNTFFNRTMNAATGGGQPATPAQMNQSVIDRGAAQNQSPGQGPSMAPPFFNKTMNAAVGENNAMNPATTPSNEVTPQQSAGSQLPQAPGNTYTPANTLIQDNAATTQDVSYQTLMNEDHGDPYVADNYVNLFSGLLDLIHGEPGVNNG